MRGWCVLFPSLSPSFYSYLYAQENGTAPDYLIGAMYNVDDYVGTALGTAGGGGPGGGGVTGIGSGSGTTANTLNFTRKICPYPLTARYTGGDWSTYENFVCN